MDNKFGKVIETIKSPANMKQVMKDLKAEVKAGLRMPGNRTIKNAAKHRIAESVKAATGTANQVKKASEAVITGGSSVATGVVAEKINEIVEEYF